MADRRRPALQQYVEKMVDGNYVAATSDVAVTTTAAKITDNDMERMALTFINIGSNPVVLAPLKNPTSSLGIRLGAQGGSLNLNAMEDMVLVGWDWYVIGDGGTSTVTVIEVKRIGVFES